VMHATRSMTAVEDLQLAADLPGWARDVASQLRVIVASLNGKMQVTNLGA
jgi:hypothetical protein